MVNTKSSESSGILPPSAALWTSPMAWVGPPLKPVADNLHEFPENALYVRAEVEYTLSESIEPGMSRQTFKTVPGLLQLEKGKPLEFHTEGIGGGCWTYRAIRDGRKTRWQRFVGSAHPAMDLGGDSDLDGTAIEYVRVSSLIPMRGSRKHVSFMIHEDGRMENLARAADPDPND